MVYNTHTYSVIDSYMRSWGQLLIVPPSPDDAAGGKILKLWACLSYMWWIDFWPANFSSRGFQRLRQY